MVVTSATGVFCFVFTTRALLCNARALRCYCGFCRRIFGGTFTTTMPYNPMMNVASIAVRLASVTASAEQLNVRWFATTTTRKGLNVVIF